ncbi:integrase [Streptomyces sp. NBC_01242]|uniref:integrase n=1 Tax=unclassified Streptomyces TaxID=2593676 RepID=UPI002255255F|nr:integrase [Streptomyces sp. NBC_01242]MCX4793173.1 integrase [Streptomyces sp. NBC_01242]WSU20134.1 integrase [Streptomyces sp. NBC_01108]
MSVLEHWSVDFYDFTVPPPPTDDPDILRFGDLLARAARNGACHGTPVIISPSGRPDPRINLFFRTGRMAAHEASTWHRYAYALIVWLDFLDAIGSSWDCASVRDVEAFKDWRITDLRNDERIRPTSFDTDRAALNSFYTWASSRYAIFNPVLTVQAEDSDETGWRPGPGYTQHRRDPLRPAGSRRRQVKWLLRTALEQWRNIGLRGFDFDGLRRDGWQGFNEDRDCAFVDGLYGTGLRVREWASVLDVELPASGAERMGEAWLAAKCIKGGEEGRKYWIPRRVLQSVEGYADPLEGSRAEVVRRAQRRGRYDRLRGVRIVTGHNPRTGELYIEGSSGPTTLALDVLSPDERRTLFRRAPGGLEPLCLWLSVSGLPKKVHSWEDTFDDANKRIAEAWVRRADPNGRLSEEERERIRGECPLWATAHMCRHSFALKWFSILSLLEERRLEGFTAEEIEDFREQLKDIWLQLAILLGHKHPDTTREHYLEPFTGLQLSYLMSLLDDDEQAGADSLVRIFARHGGSTIMPIAAAAGPGGAL